VAQPKNIRRRKEKKKKKGGGKTAPEESSPTLPFSAKREEKGVGIKVGLSATSSQPHIEKKKRGEKKRGEKRR